MSEEYVVRQCAPTLAGIKTGSLFPCPYQSRQALMSEIRALNRRLSPKGLILLPVRYLDGKALILDINYFLKEFVPGLTEEIASHSIYDFIENVLGMQIITSKRRITVEHATARDEKLLDMDGYDCVAVVVNQTFNSDGMLFEYTQSRHHPDYFCFQDIATRKKS